MKILPLVFFDGKSQNGFALAARFERQTIHILTVLDANGFQEGSIFMPVLMGISHRVYPAHRTDTIFKFDNFNRRKRSSNPQGKL
jgi:hypothetical protein